jgi:phosphate transport system substrate-binding protein
MGLTIVGSNTIGDQLMPALIRNFAEQNRLNMTRAIGGAGVATDTQFKLEFGNRTVGTIDLQRHGTNAAFKRLESSGEFIGMAARPMRNEEADKLTAAGINARTLGSEHILGLDGLQILVSPENKLPTLGLDNLAKVFAGQITDWSELGGNPGRINVYAPAAGSEGFELFDEVVMQPRRLELTRTVRRMDNDAEQSDAVARDPNGIGVASMTNQRNARPLNLQLTCGLIAKPVAYNIKTEEYPLSRRLYLYAPSATSAPFAQSLVAYALSPAGQAVVRQNDFVDLSPEAATYESQMARVANSLHAGAEQFDAGLMHELVQEIKTAKRLSLTFRFQRNSASLDNRALADIARLKAALQSPEFKSSTVSLIGFADPRGNFGENVLLSERRARAVHAALAADQTVSMSKVRVKAFGGLAPVACSDEDHGRNLNRRVEVWVR